MSIPEKCTVLVVGGGPAGSTAAAALAREGIDVVVLEAEKFPRYHIGESMLPSIRHFLKFIGAYKKWTAHGFYVKNGGAFKLDHSFPETYTDFVASGGPEGYAWNVIRSEADELLFKHAGSCGAKVFDATRVREIIFEPHSVPDKASDLDENNLGRPVQATWKDKDGNGGTISFQYLVDASGRRGILSTTYMKNRQQNQGLQNMAHWGYWKGGGAYGVGTHKEGSPFFEALLDGSGWCWYIPLHDGTHSVGIIQKQEIVTTAKRSPTFTSTQNHYLGSLEGAPGIKSFLGEHATLVSGIKSACDWSYSASSYALPYARIAGDAGSFIDPFFSSGCHLAMNGGLSAAVTIAASIRGDCDEYTAASWHSKRITESYTRFLLVVLSATKQIHQQYEPVIHDFDEKTFERAFNLFLPVIQGTVDADPEYKLTQTDVSKVVEFCFQSFTDVPKEQSEALVQKLKNLGIDEETDGKKVQQVIKELQENLTLEESRILDILRARRMLRHEDAVNIRYFTLDSIDGLVPLLERGSLGLREAGPVNANSSQLFSASFLKVDLPDIRTQRADSNSQMPLRESNGTSNGSGAGCGEEECIASTVTITAPVAKDTGAKGVTSKAATEAAPSSSIPPIGSDVGNGDGNKGTNGQK